MAMTGNGLRDAMLAAMEAEFGAPSAETLAQWTKAAQAMGDAIVDYVSANADVRITTGDAGLQRDNTGGNPATLAPSADVVLTGAIE